MKRTSESQPRHLTVIPMSKGTKSTYHKDAKDGRLWGPRRQAFSGYGAKPEGSNSPAAVLTISLFPPAHLPDTFSVIRIAETVSTRYES